MVPANMNAEPRCHIVDVIGRGAMGGTQLKGQFLIDRDGIVRWAQIECGQEGLAGLGKFLSHDELMTAARIVVDGG